MTPKVSVQLAETIVSSLEMSDVTFAVSHAFLCEMSSARAIHVRAPAGCVPAVGNRPCVAPCRSLWVLNGENGLTEAPRVVCASTREAYGTCDDDRVEMWQSIEDKEIFL